MIVVDVFRFCTVRALLAAIAIAAASPMAPARAEPINGEATVTTDGGFARLLIRLDEEVESKVSMSGAVLIIEFKKPVSIPVERINIRAPDYFSAARQDPDGTAIRIALARKVKINTINAAERLYVDLLPENWVGVVPGLPQPVIDELARRVREAEGTLRKQQLAAKPQLQTTIRVKVGVQPTFIRYIFELPAIATATPARGPGKFTLNFNQPLRFDLADATATLPASIERIDSEHDRDSASVIFRLKGKPLVRSYREGHSIVVDVGVTASTKRGAIAPNMAPAAAEPEKTAKAAAPTVASPETVQVESEAASANTDSAAVALMEADAKPMEPAAESAPTGPVAKQDHAGKLAAPAPTSAPPPAVAPKPPAAPDAAPKVAALPKTAPATPPTSQAPAAPPASAAAPEPTAPPLPPDILSGKKKVEPKAAVEAPAPSPRLPTDPNAPVTVVTHTQGGNLRIDFPFAAPTPAAVFRRGRALWLVFDSGGKLDVSGLKDERLIRNTTIEQGADGEAIVRIELEQPKLASFFSDGPGWVLIIGDAVVEPTKPVAIARSIVGKGRASITIPFAGPRKLHRISDPDAGDSLLVVTALGPARGFLKAQDFVELRALASTHGIVVQPLADDVAAELAADKIVISRPGGLSLSSSSIASRDNTNNGGFQPLIFDTQTWGFDRQAKFEERQMELLGRAAAAPEAKRRAARLDLARFYLARDMAPEAKGVLDVATADERDGEGATGTVLKAVANVMMKRPDDALKDLANPAIGDNADAPIWRAMAHASQGQWAVAREEFKKVEGAIGALPIELQRLAKRELLRCSVEVRDFAGGSTLLNEFETLGVPPEMAPDLQVLSGRVEEGLGHNAEALAAYRLAASSRDRRAAAKGRLRDTVLRFKLGDLKPKDVISQLEELTTAWRGDETEAEGLQLLAHLYTEEKRPRDAFHVMRTALLAHPNSDLTRKIQDEAATTFDSLFMSSEGDAMPAIEALGLFYDYRELTPIGRRGDEMIRRLADRLVAVDLLDQAAELLQHQVDNRLQGAARAQVATKLATIYLMNRKPDRALAVLQKTRLSEITSDLRDQRLLLESRALSDIGRHELALEVIEGMKGAEALRLRADILWSAKKWRPAAEAIELLYGQRWKDFTPLTDQERTDVLRAAIAYALAEEPMGLTRFREKYAAKMNDGPDRRAFEVVSAPIGSASKEFRAVAGAIGNVNTLDAFLRDMRKRYPDKDQPGDGPAASAPETTKPDGKAGEKTAEAAKPAKPAQPEKPPAAAPAKPDGSPTGSIRRRVAPRSR
jgi:tetratricopeptide (TPR) repeat protein